MAYYGFGSILPVNPLVAALAGLPKNFNTGAMLKSSSPAAAVAKAAYVPTPIVSTGPVASVIGVSSDPSSPAFFNQGASCPGCAPQGFEQAYPQTQSAGGPVTLAAAPAGLVDVSVDTTPLLLLGLLALAYFAFRK